MLSIRLHGKIQRYVLFVFTEQSYFIYLVNLTTILNLDSMRVMGIHNTNLFVSNLKSGKRP